MTGHQFETMEPTISDCLSRSFDGSMSDIQLLTAEASDWVYNLNINLSSLPKSRKTKAEVQESQFL